MKPHPIHLLAAALGCSSGQPAEEPPRPATIASASALPVVPVMYASSPAPLAAAPDAVVPLEELLARLAPRAVESSTIGRRVLLSWTTREQAEAIAAGGALLTRVDSPLYGPSGFDWMLDSNVAKGDKLARFLFQRHYAKKRFAWPNAYATASGAGGGRYGAVLLLVELRADALIIDYPRKRVLTVDNREIPFSELEAKPERLAAVFWEEGELREYVLVNESAIARVSSGTTDALEIFRTERALLDALAKTAPQLSSHDDVLLTVAFARTLAFSRNAGESQFRAIRAMAREANDVPPDSFEFAFVPSMPFAASGARPRLANPGCKLKKTNDFSYRRTLCEPTTRCHHVAGKCEITRVSVRELEPRD